MKIAILMSSGDEDIWEEDLPITTAETEAGLCVLRAFPDGSQRMWEPGVRKLEVVYKTEGDPIAGFPDVKTTREETSLWEILAVYAPGMWMREKFE